MNLRTRYNLMQLELARIRLLQNLYRVVGDDFEEKMETWKQTNLQ